MQKHVASEIAGFIDRSCRGIQRNYEISAIYTGESVLRGFHQWADGKNFVAAFQIKKQDEELFYILLIDWHRNGNYYLVIYSPDKSTTYAEIRETVEGEGETCLLWKYNPLKRDGKNGFRKAYFKKRFGTTDVRIPLPQSEDDVEEFIGKLDWLAKNRLAADRSANQINADQIF